jgi:hypothetical protein
MGGAVADSVSTFLSAPPTAALPLREGIRRTRHGYADIKSEGVRRQTRIRAKAIFILPAFC